MAAEAEENLEQWFIDLGAKYHYIWEQRIARELDGWVLVASRDRQSRPYDWRRILRNYMRGDWRRSERRGVRRRYEQRASRDGVRSSRAEVEAGIRRNGIEDLQRLDAELNLMMHRSSVIIAAATVLLAVYGFIISSAFTLANGLLSASFVLTAIAFMASLVSLSPPFWRAWAKPYEKRAAWTLLAIDDFGRWALDCWLSDRRTPVITRYKRTHSIAVPFLIAATGSSIASLAISFFFG